MHAATKWFCIFLVVPMATAAGSLAGETTTVVHPQDTGAALVNPGMGWVLHHYDNIAFNYGGKLEPSDTVDDFPGVTTIYLRIAWSYLEPQDGQFNWSVLDAPTQRWLDKGKQIALRISCSESFMRYATPEWVEKAGAKGHNFRSSKGIDPNGPYWEPDFDDPVFVEKLDHFLAALAERYDGNPEVAFIDVGSIGVWGEGHTFASTRKVYPAATIRKHIDLHKKHFKRTLLAANDDYGPMVIMYAFDNGLTLRDDSILVQGGNRAYFNAEMASTVWPRLPVILESEHYGTSKKRGFWGDGSQYLQAVEDYHASYATVHWYPRPFLEEARPLIDRINMRLGYRIQLLEASWPGELPPGAPLAVGYRWRNAGVAPCLPGGYPAITLKDDKGGIAAVFVDEEFDVRSLPVGPRQASRQASFLLPPAPIFKPGSYSVYISVGSRTGTPKIALPLPGEDGQRRYRLGEIAVR